MRPVLVPLVTGVLGLIVLLSLGVWQVQRLQWKEGVLARIDARIDGTPQPLPETPTEENDEYLEAAMNGDVVEVADALGDQLYILAGTMMRHGMQDVIAKVFREIQASNMSKLGPDGAPILREDGKVMKGPNYFRPNIAGILEADAMERADAPASAPLDKLAWSVGNEPAPLDRLAHTELGTEMVEAEGEAELAM